MTKTDARKLQNAAVRLSIYAYQCEPAWLFAFYMLSWLERPTFDRLLVIYKQCEHDAISDEHIAAYRARYESLSAPERLSLLNIGVGVAVQNYIFDESDTSRFDGWLELINITYGVRSNGKYTWVFIRDFDGMQCTYADVGLWLNAIAGNGSARRKLKLHGCQWNDSTVSRRLSRLQAYVEKVEQFFGESYATAHIEENMSRVFCAGMGDICTETKPANWLQKCKQEARQRQKMNNDEFAASLAMRRPRRIEFLENHEQK